MARKGSTGSKVDSLLEKAIDDLVKKVALGKKDEEGKPYTLTDVMKVIDRKLKLEAIKMKADDAGYGSAFGDEEPENDDGT
jgi:hypothetical protein